MSKEEECNPSTREMHRGNTKRRKLKKRNKNLSPRPDVKKKTQHILLVLLIVSVILVTS
jgi:hypothetical protein